jgi:hypothetical protein
MSIGMGTPIPYLANLPGPSKPGGGGGGGGGLAQIDNLNSMSFDGTDDFINVGSSEYLNGLNKMSVSTWINSDGYEGSSEQNILNDWNYNTANGHFRYDVTTSGHLRASIKVSTTTYGARIADSFTFTDGTWYYTTFVFDGTLTGNENRLKIYINGIEQTTTQFSYDIPATLQNSTSTINIGRFGPTSPRLFKGKLDEVGIFNTALTDAEILSIYNATAVVDGVNKTADLSQLTTPPIAWYRM